MADDEHSKVAVIAGGAKGIGLRIAQRFYAAGYDIALVDIDEAAARVGISRLAAGDPKIRFFWCDLRLPQSIEMVSEEIHAWSGSVDVLVNNARTRPKADFGSETAASWDETMAVCCRAPFLLSRSMLPSIESGGSIINIGSVVGRTVAAESPAYHAAKAGLEHLSRYLAVYCGPRGVRVNCILPGFVVQDRHLEKYWSTENEGYREATLGCIPREAPGSEVDVAELALFLASYHSRFLSGEAITLDGGASRQDPFLLGLKPSSGAR